MKNSKSKSKKRIEQEEPIEPKPKVYYRTILERLVPGSIFTLRGDPAEPEWCKTLLYCNYCRARVQYRDDEGKLVTGDYAPSTEVLWVDGDPARIQFAIGLKRYKLRADMNPAEKFVELLQARKKVTYLEVSLQEEE